MLLLLLSLLPIIQSTEPPKTLHKTVEACPSVGYFFERQPQPGVSNELGPCYLCYCNGDGRAVCTLRGSDRCDEGNYSYHTEVEETTVRKHRRRKHGRRSRRSLMELFFNDAKKDQLLKGMAQSDSEDCKPKASKSIGCPPKDWCTGCLVCDCDDDSRWQCHVMSFCDDKTPRPKSKKGRKHTLKEIILQNEKIKEISTKATPVKKTVKRSVKYTKNSNRSTTRKSFVKKEKGKRSPAKNIEITAKKPTMPLISVKTRKSFVRKNQTSNVIIIKKYISTVSPIESPELLKYKNDSRKLAQILYQQYETSSKQSKNVKREIKFPSRAGGKTLFTHEFVKKNKAKYDVANSKNMGDKILSTKQIAKLKLKSNVVVRKPMNVKEHNDRNTKMKALKEKRVKKSHNNFYLERKVLMEPDKNNQLDRKNKEAKNKDVKGNYERKEKIKLMTLGRRRNKRDVSLIMESSNSTNIENKIGNTTVNIDNVTEVSTTFFMNNEEIASSLNNYVYTVDNIVMPNYNNNGVINSDTGYETTLKYVDLITIGDTEKKNITVSYTDITDYETTENSQQTKDYFQKFDWAAFDEMFAQEKPADLKANHSLVTTTYFSTIDYTLNEIPTTEKQMDADKDVERTIFVNNTIPELYKDEKECLDNANEMTLIDKVNNNTNMTTDQVNKLYAKYIDTIITGFNKCKLKKSVDTQKSKEKLNTAFTVTSKNTFKKDVEAMLQRFSNNTKTVPRQNRMLAIKYLKKIYSKKLLKKNNKPRFNNVAVMESICDTFGSCKISSKSVEELNSKINELISETKRALNVITTIKVFLQIMEVGKNSSGVGNISEEADFKCYVKKLNAILTDAYEMPLSDAQRLQINVIKNKTKEFINSIGKFAFILNDILKIIHSDKTKYDTVKKRKIILHKFNTHKVNTEPLNRIKDLFLKFNLLQNTFMRNMYQAISDLEVQNNKNSIRVGQNMNNKKEVKYKTSLDKYMKKISYNLSKLKDLALKMGARERRKRHAMRDDGAIEYLLTLMEYLLKVNNPLDSPPVTDGIDLLIDAIRRAPHIKPIKVNRHKLPGFSNAKEVSKSSSESADENESVNNQTEILKDNFSFEKSYNDTQILRSNIDNDIEEFMSTSQDPRNRFSEVTTTAKNVDVEDLVFNGEKLQNVYMATFPTFENTEDPYFVIDELKSNSLNNSKIGTKYPAVLDTDDVTIILANATDSKTEVKKDIHNLAAREKTIKTQFDLLNEEYEKRLKMKTPKTIKIKHRKPKRARKKKLNKSDVSSITKEIDEERTRKKIIAEEAILRKHMFNSVDDDPFKSVGEESASADLSPLDATNKEPFQSFFT